MKFIAQYFCLVYVDVKTIEFVSTLLTQIHIIDYLHFVIGSTVLTLFSVYRFFCFGSAMAN